MKTTPEKLKELKERCKHYVETFADINAPETSQQWADMLGALDDLETQVRLNTIYQDSADVALANNSEYAKLRKAAKEFLYQTSRKFHSQLNIAEDHEWFSAHRKLYDLVYITVFKEERIHE